MTLAAVAWLPSALAGQAEAVSVSHVSRSVDLAALVGEADGLPEALEGFTRVEGFIQRNPSDGHPAEHPTRAYLGYDELALYVVFVAHDPEPGRIRARMSPRENIGGDDFVTLMLDTDHDRRRAYAFRANPRGVQWDALWTEGQGFDTSFDAVWRSEARLTPTGYVVGFEIPFKSLRFPTIGARSWGLVLSRDVPREQGEVSYWPAVSSEVQGTLTQAAELRGVTGVEPGRNIQVIPYTNTRSFRALDRRADGGPRFVRNDAELDAGGDFKAVLDDRFVIDVTANPDFSQVESDRPQVTVNRRFEVFFPERRPFFTENADYFRTPISVLFTRRIADPRLGTRFTGKAGAWSLGALAIDDEAPGKLSPAGSPLAGKRARFTVGRVSRDIGAFSRVGAIYAGRELDGGFNRVGGVDGRVRIDDHWTASGQVVGSRTRDVRDGAGAMPPSEDGYAAAASVSRSGRSFSYSGSYTDFSPEFAARSGFVTRTDQRTTSHFASYFFRPEGVLISWGPEAFVVRRWDHEGTLLDEITEGSLEWSFVGGTYFEVNFRHATEWLRPEDHPALSRTRSFDVGQWDIEYGTSYLDWLQVSGNLRLGKQTHLRPPDGASPAESDWRQLNLNVGFRPATQLRIDNTLLWTTLDDPSTGGRILTDRIVRTGWNWQFTRALSLRAILQYERTSVDGDLTSVEPRENLNADLLLTYRLNPWTAVYAGVNANGQNVELVDLPTGGRGLQRVEGLRNDAHQFFVKASYLLRF